MTTANQVDKTNRIATVASAQQLKPKFATLYRRAIHPYLDVHHLQRCIDNDKGLKRKEVMSPVLKNLEVVLLEHCASLFSPVPAIIPYLAINSRAVATAQLGLQKGAAA